MMKYDCVLFDLDGTLVDSRPGIFASIRYALEKLNYPLDETSVVMDDFLGPPLEYGFESVLRLPADLIDKAVLLYREFYRETGVLMATPYKGIPQLLDLLRQEGIKVGLATSKPTVFSEKILRRLQLADRFDALVGVPLDKKDVSKSDVIGQSLSLCGASAQKSAMVGDRKYDMLGAKDNGLTAIGVLYGYGSEKELSDSGAVYLADTVQSLKDLLL